MNRPHRRAVFLDRDGVLIQNTIRNGKPYAVTPSEKVVLFDDAVAACKSLRDEGYLLIMATNQPDIRRGLTTSEFVQETNDRLMKLLGLDDIRVCYHDAADNCACRKPNPGLLFAAAEQFGINLSQSFMVGDRRTDILAGARAGCRTVFIERGYWGEIAEGADFITNSLASAAEWVVAVS